MTLDAPKISLIVLSVAVVFLLKYHYSAVELRHMNVHGTALHGIACIKKDHVLSMHHIYSFCMRQSWYVTCLAFLLLDFGPGRPPTGLGACPERWCPRVFRQIFLLKQTFLSRTVATPAACPALSPHRLDWSAPTPSTRGR